MVTIFNGSPRQSAHSVYRSRHRFGSALPISALPISDNTLVSILTFAQSKCHNIHLELASWDVLSVLFTDWDWPVGTCSVQERKHWTFGDLVQNVLSACCRVCVFLRRFVQISVFDDKLVWWILLPYKNDATAPRWVWRPAYAIVKHLLQLLVHLAFHLRRHPRRLLVHRSRVPRERSDTSIIKLYTQCYSMFISYHFSVTNVVNLLP